MSSSLVSRAIIFVLLIMSIQYISFAENIEFNTQNRKICFTKPSIEKAIEKKYKNENDYFWVVFEKKTDSDTKKQFEKSGIKILKFGNSFGSACAYILKISTNVQKAINAMKKCGILVGIEEIEPLDKISPEILDPQKFRLINTYDSTDATIKARIDWYEGVPEQTATALLKQLGVEQILSFDSVANRYKVLLF